MPADDSSQLSQVLQQALSMPMSPFDGSDEMLGCSCEQYIVGTVRCFAY
jgi:hypothetical protein